MEGNNIALKSDLKVPAFLFGARLPLDFAIYQIYNKLKRIVTQIPNATLQDALDVDFILLLFITSYLTTN